KRHITVTEEETTRYLLLDGSEESAMDIHSHEPVFDYQWFHKVSYFLEKPLKRALVLGAGAFTIPKCLALDHSQAIVDAVDLEPDLEAIGRKYFHLDESEFGRIRFYGVTALEFLSGEQSIPYDFIFDDLFDGYQHVPDDCRGDDYVSKICSHL